MDQVADDIVSKGFLIDDSFLEKQSYNIKSTYKKYKFNNKNYTSFGEKNIELSNVLKSNIKDLNKYILELNSPACTNLRISRGKESFLYTLENELFILNKEIDEHQLERTRSFKKQLDDYEVPSSKTKSSL